MIGQLISNGYLVMETCCFVHYCKRDTGKGFNYLDVRNYIETNGYAPAITPYTLYEFIQGCTSPKERCQGDRSVATDGSRFTVNGD